MRWGSRLLRRLVNDDGTGGFFACAFVGAAIPRLYRLTASSEGL